MGKVRDRRLKIKMGECQSANEPIYRNPKTSCCDLLFPTDPSDMSKYQGNLTTIPGGKKRYVCVKKEGDI